MRLSGISVPRVALLAAAALFLASCAGLPQTKVYDDRMFEIYSPDQLRQAAPLPLTVLGGPPDGSDIEEIAQAMRLPDRFGGTVLTPTRGVPGGWRFVVSFYDEAPPNLCRIRQRFETQSGGNGVVMAFAYCYDRRLVTGARMVSNTTLGPRDSAFRTAVERLYAVVLPPVNKISIRPPSG